MSIVSIYTLFADGSEAERIGRAVVEERLAACVNLLGPAQSIYRWQGNLETTTEVVAIFKTVDDKAEALITRIASMHSYDVPCIAALPIDRILKPYADWVEESVG